LKRRGFGLITAIIIMMTVAILMSLMIGLSSSTVKQTSNLFIKEQARLYLRSATEFALLAISGHDNSSDCIKDITINFDDNKYKANVNIWYMGKGIPASCNSNIIDKTVQTIGSNYTVIMDVIVEANQTKFGLSEPIKLYRRTLQKP